MLKRENHSSAKRTNALGARDQRTAGSEIQTGGVVACERENPRADDVECDRNRDAPMSTQHSDLGTTSPVKRKAI